MQPIELPDDLTRRLERLASKGQDINTLVREAIETRLAIEEQIEKNLEGWSEEELRAAIQEGLDSGPATPLDMEAIKRRALQQWEASRQG
jgi:predicted transcriptional regulator